MWLFLGFGAAVAAASMADLLLSRGDDEKDESDPDATFAQDEVALQNEHAATTADLFRAMLTDEPSADEPDERRSSMGLFDNLSERIHSSDLFEPEKPVSPVSLKGGDIGSLLRGGVADDTLEGGDGNDTLLGSGGQNLLVAGSGDNHLIGGEGDDTLIGGAGDDTLEGGWGDDLLVANGGNNVLMGGAGDDTLVGAALDAEGADTSGQSFLNGGAGNDLLIAGQSDIVSGGEGDDTFALGDWLKGMEPVTIMDYQPGRDQIVLHYDPERLSEPEVSVTFQPDQPDTAEIRLNDHVVAFVVAGEALRSEDVALIAGHPSHLSQAAG